MRTNWQIKMHQKMQYPLHRFQLVSWAISRPFARASAANRQRSFVIAPHLLAGRADMYERPMKTVWIYVDTGKEVGRSTIQGLCQ